MSHAGMDPGRWISPGVDRDPERTDPSLLLATRDQPVNHRRLP